VSVFLVDDYAPMRKNLRWLLEFERDFTVCGEAGDVETALAGMRAAKPDIAIVDLALGNQSGFDLLRRLRENGPPVGVLVLSMLPAEQNAALAMTYGAKKYLTKSDSPDTILDALRAMVDHHPSDH